MNLTKIAIDTGTRYINNIRNNLLQSIYLLANTYDISHIILFQAFRSQFI